MEPLPLVRMKLAPSVSKGQRRRTVDQSNNFDSSSTLTPSTPLSNMGALPLVQGLLLLRPHFSEPQGGTSTCTPVPEGDAGGPDDYGRPWWRPSRFRSPCSRMAQLPLKRQEFSAV